MIINLIFENIFFIEQNFNLRKMLMPNLSIRKKRRNFLLIIQLFVIISYFALITKTQETHSNIDLFRNANKNEYSNELLESSVLSIEKLNKIDYESNSKEIESNKENLNPNYFSIFTKIKTNFASLIKTDIKILNTNKNTTNENTNLISFAATTQQIQSNPKSTLNCKSNPKLKSLVISTNLDPDSEDFSIEILRECEISEMWRSSNLALKSCESPKRAIEGEDNIRRAFRFSYLAPQNPSLNSNLTESSIIINKMSLEFPTSAAESTLTKSKLTINPGDVTDIYLNYDCKSSEESNTRGDNWYKLKVLLDFEEGQQQSFEFIKVCNASYIESVDASHFIIISFIFLVAYLSTKDFLKSKFEVIIVEKYTEMRNPENLLLIGLVVLLILIFLGATGSFASWTTFVVVILAPISIAMIGEALLKYNDTLTHLESRSYEIPFIGSISFLFSLCLGVGLVIVTIYFYTENWIFNNLIAIALALISIRLFKLTNFKLIMIMFSLRFLYDLIWSYYYSQYFSENFRLSNNSENHLPIKFLCPEFAATPFNSCNFLPIADIILPGILCTYAKIFDESKGLNVYFLAANASLAAGLIFNMFVYYSYKLPLPSFLFSGPVMIITMVVLAHNRSHLDKFVEGFSSTLLENNLDKNLKKISFQQKMKAEVQYIPPKI